MSYCTPLSSTTLTDPPPTPVSADVKRKTIYEYHRIDMKGYTIGNNTAVVFTAQPTCVSLRSCEKCLNHPSIDFKVRVSGHSGAEPPLGRARQRVN